MKKIGLLMVVFLSLFFSTTPAHSQTLSGGLSWSYVGPYFTFTEDCWIDGTKELNGKNYHQLYLEVPVFVDGARAEAPGHGLSTSTIGIREENGRVLVNKDEYQSLVNTLSESGIFAWGKIVNNDIASYETTADGELVIYDFTKQVGDVYCQLSDGTSLTVTNTNVLKTEDGVSRRCLTLSNGFELIEGVGCTNSRGLLLFWLNFKTGYDGIPDIGVLVNYGTKMNDGSTMTLFAQDYSAVVRQRTHPNKMLTQGRRWVYNYDNGEMQGTLTYTIEGDTLLHAYKRAKLYMTLVDSQTKQVVRSGYAGALHEKEDNVCFLAPDGIEESALYCFFWPETMTKYQLDNMLNLVVYADNVTVEGDAMRRYQLVSWPKDAWMPMDKESLYYWVEGIGSSKGLLGNKAGDLADKIRFVGCYDGDNCIFTNDDFGKDCGRPFGSDLPVNIKMVWYTISFSEETASVSYSDNSLADVVIPSAVELWGNSYKVDGFEELAFKGRTNISSVVISEGVTSIPAQTFRECTGLQSVTLPSTIDTIQKGTFFGCSSLNTVVLAEGLKTIETSAFSKCTSLTKVEIPASVEKIMHKAFAACTNLTDVYCRSITPPASLLNDSEFPEGKPFFNCNAAETLHVPSVSIEAYKTTKPWSDFKYIVPIDAYSGVVVPMADTVHSPLFDLQGRRIQGSPKHGVYIMNGKKVMK